MGQAKRRRSRRGKRMVAASVTLILGGAGLIAVNSYAAAGEGQGPWPGGGSDQGQSQIRSAGVSGATIKCPEVANGLPEVPEAARPEVDGVLAQMDSQITDAYQRFAEEKEQVDSDPLFVQNSILGPLKDKRAAGLERIAAAIGQGSGQRPQGLESMAACTLQADATDATDAGKGNEQKQGQEDGGGDGQNNGNGGQAGNGPNADDFVDIQSIQPNVQNPRKLRSASRGTFTTDCGVNENGKFNPDNVIVAPGVSNGAHHMHDYVGNQANDAFASDDDLAGGDTTCQNQGDKSTYYWPVLRLQNGQNEADANADGGGNDSNVGEIQTPTQVTLNFAGNPVSKVTAMPRFLRIITGDAKAFTNGDANANASWSCTGFEDRQLKDKYPICPEGSQVVRSFKFQSCWDGQNTDSANHRTHVAFAQANGACPQGFRAIPQLVQRIVYDVPPGPGFAVDSFPEQLHKPGTDHGDFINVFDDNLMRELVSCVNDGRECGQRAPDAAPDDSGQKPDVEPRATTEAPAETPAEQEKPDDTAPPKPRPEPTPDGTSPPAGKGAGDGSQSPEEPAEPSAGNADAQEERPGAADEAEKPGAAAAPDPARTPAKRATPRSDQNTPAPKAAGPTAQDRPDAAGDTAKPEAAAASDAGRTPSSPATPRSDRNAPEPQVAGTAARSAPGTLATTGAQLWPSAAGAVLLVVGILLLRARSRRETTVRPPVT